VILVDISAWVGFLRGTRSRVCEELDRLLDGVIAITDPIVMELLAGARDGRHLHGLRALLGRTQMARCGPRDFDAASLLYRRCRSSGETVRRLIDCLVAAVAIREEFYILHADADFEVLAQHTELVIHRA
jgi:predicted nucleic acid-binding protein